MAIKLPAAAVAALCISSVPLAAGELKAGAAKVDITPDSAVFPITGHVNFTGIHDNLYARALVVSDGTTKVTFVVLDEGSVPDPARMLTIISDASGIPQSNIILSASHTHNVTMSNAFGRPDPAMQKQIAHIQQGGGGKSTTTCRVRHEKRIDCVLADRRVCKHEQRRTRRQQQ